MTGAPSFTEHRIPQGQGNLYAREYPGAGPAFVLMHGFPDNLLIYDRLIPYLAAGGRRVVAFDFLGFGASEKPGAATYSVEQQIGNLEAVSSISASRRSSRSRTTPPASSRSTTRWRIPGASLR